MDTNENTQLCSCGHVNPSTLEQCEQCQLKLSVEKRTEKKRKKDKKKSNTETETSAKENEQDHIK